MTDNEIKAAIKEMKAKIKHAEENPNVLTGAPTIPAGAYSATLELKDGVPIFDVTPLPGTKFSKSSVSMNLTADSDGAKLPKQDVNYNSTLKQILLTAKYWNQQFIVHTEDRLSSKNNPYQVIVFDGVLEMAGTE